MILVENKTHRKCPISLHRNTRKLQIAICSFVNFGLSQEKNFSELFFYKYSVGRNSITRLNAQTVRHCVMYMYIFFHYSRTFSSMRSRNHIQLQNPSHYPRTLSSASQKPRPTIESFSLSQNTQFRVLEAAFNYRILLIILEHSVPRPRSRVQL